MTNWIDWFAGFSEQVDEGFFLLGIVMLAAEMLRWTVGGGWSWRRLGDIGASIGAFGLFLVVEIFLFAGLLSAYFLAQPYALIEIPVTPWTLVFTLLVADFVYYWEHRASHRVRLFWTTHAVHHSSRHMNLAVSVRFGYMDSLVAFLFHFPLILIGFDPVAVIGSQVLVLGYQTWIHTEMIGKLGWLDNIINTPANHRVHHGCDDKYIDKNYGGILMLWDQLFGTYKQEEETPRYGLARDFESNNPFVVFVSEIPRFISDVLAADGLRNKLGIAFRYPGWVPEHDNKKPL